MTYHIREMKPSEYPLLKNFLYEAIFIPEGMEPPSRSVLELPELQVYICKFGEEKYDKALVAEVEDQIVGAVWVRIMNDYGHVDDETPSFAISLYKEYRGMGIGTELMRQMLELLRKNGYKKASLSVQRANYAVRMYRKVGFAVFREDEEEYIMVNDLQEVHS